MASTRSRNTPGNYAIEQRTFAEHHNYMSYEKSSFYGTVPNAYFPGQGLIGMKAHGQTLSSNSADIESQLFGIGSTNLVQAQTPIAPDVYQLKSLNIADKLPVVVPAPFQADTNQRTMFLN